jgi:predicted permease
MAVFIRLAPASLPHPDTIRLDPAVLGFTFAVSVFAGIFFGLAPAMQSSRTDLSDSLKESIRSSACSLERQGLRRVLILSEVALSFVLLVGSGLLLRSLAKLLNVNPGFDPTNVLTLRLSPSNRADPAQAASFSSALLGRISAMPGVLEAALAEEPPFMQPGNSVFAIRDYHLGPDSPQPHADNVTASPDYFAAMRIPLLHGRIYTRAEMLTAGGEIQKDSVLVIDEALAQRFWPGQDAVGKQIGWTNGGPWGTIVGVVGTVRSHTLTSESKGTIYFPLYGKTLVVRTASDPTALVDALRAQVEAVDPNQAVYDVKTMRELVAESVEQQRFAAALLAVFAVLALVLAAGGLYGVMAYFATQRTHEIGIRMALGAQHQDVLRLVVGQGIRLVLLGIAVGVAAGFGFTRLLSSFLFSVKVNDPTTFTGVAILLTLVSLAACYIPARRAMRVDPMIALRYE